MPPLRLFVQGLGVAGGPLSVPLDPLAHRDDSQSEVLALHCLATTDRAAALAALLEHRADVPVATGTCGQQTAQRTLITVQVFGVRGSAPPCAAGAAGSTPAADALGRSRGGFGTKIHAITDALGNPWDVVLTSGQASDIG